ncbi:unnamed protein product [Brachionus calyciflorus]|uniref:RING-type domain-containing protein n=1 Tax=Brachionus calyciflorus TaxID=104777 RepID=A0A814HA02_9BILA|nr:unnamed protein product [Brachionus calyciflorus]
MVHCRICKRSHDKPLFLPCEESICSKCIQEISIDREFECIFCFKTHTVPIEGMSFKARFPINESLIKSIKNTLSGNSTECEELKERVNNAEKVLKNLKTSLENGIHNIHEYCSKLINAIDLVTETKIKNIQDSRHKVIMEINGFENECLENFNHKVLENYNKLIKEAECLLEHEKNELNKMEFNEKNTEKTKSIKSIKSIESNLNNINREVNKIIFNDISLKYIFDDLTNEFKVYKINNSEIDFNHFKKIDLLGYFDTKYNSKYNILVGLLDNRNFVINYVETNGYKDILEIRNFTKGNEFIKSWSVKIEDNFRNSALKCYKNKIVFFNESVDGQMIRIFDEDLVQVEAEISYILESFAVSEDKILALAQIPDNSLIIIYDWKLNQLTEVGSFSNNFFFCDVITDLCENEKYYFIIESNVMRIINKEDEKFVRSLDIPENNEFVIANSKNIIVQNLSDNGLNYLDFHGIIADTKKLVNAPNRKLKIISNDLLTFYDSENLVLYISPY